MHFPTHLFKLRNVVLCMQLCMQLVVTHNVNNMHELWASHSDSACIVLFHGKSSGTILGCTSPVFWKQSDHSTQSPQPCFKMREKEPWGIKKSSTGYVCLCKAWLNYILPWRLQTAGLIKRGAYLLRMWNGWVENTIKILSNVDTF